MQRREDNVAARLNGNALQPLADVAITVTDDKTGLPASLYSDNGVTPITQPLITDNNGYYGYYAANGEYTETFTSPRIATFTRSAVLADPDDNPNVKKAELGAGSGASLISHNGRRLDAKLEEFLSIKDAPFNAKGDGTTDDTAAIQAAIDAARRDGDGYQSAASRRVFLPNGVYRISDKLKCYNGTFLDGESPGGVVFRQVDPTKGGVENVDAATGVNQKWTIRNLEINYPVASTTPGVYGIKASSSTAITPILENVRVTRAWTGFNFELTINATLTGCGAVNCTLTGFKFSDVGGMHNSAATIVSCYAQGCGGYGYEGPLIGSTLVGVASDRNDIGYSLKLINSHMQGTSEGCTSFGAIFDGAESSRMHLMVVTANGAQSGISLLNTKDITLDSPRVSWGGGGNGYGLRIDPATCTRITVTNPSIDSFALGRYSDTTKINVFGRNITHGLTPESVTHAIGVGFSGGSGASGATHTSGVYVGSDNGYGASLQVWDEITPRGALLSHAAGVPTYLMQWSYLGSNILFAGAPVLKSPGGSTYKLVVSDAGALSAVPVTWS